MNELLFVAMLFLEAIIAFVGWKMWRRSVKPNPFLGVRTRKTLSDEQTWYEVNAIAGAYFFAAGIVGVAIFAGTWMLESSMEYGLAYVFNLALWTALAATLLALSISVVDLARKGLL